MPDPRQSMTLKLDALARAGGSGLALAQIGAGTAVFLALHGLVQPITPETKTVFVTRQGMARAQMMGHGHGGF